MPADPARARRTGVALAVVAAVVVVAGAVVLPSVLGGDDDAEGPRADPGGKVDTSSLAAVEEYDVGPWEHVSDDVTYEQTPPVGGDHWDDWLQCGVYGGVVPDEYAVHDLEHGAVWITYRPDDLDEAEIGELSWLLPQNGIMSPYPNQEAPVVITAWERQLALLGPDDPRIGLFLEKYGAGETAPEAFGSCAGGITAPPSS